MLVDGGLAVALGIAWLGACLIMLSKYCIGTIDRIGLYAELAFILGLLAVIGGLGFVIVHVLVNFAK